MNVGGGWVGCGIRGVEVKVELKVEIEEEVDEDERRCFPEEISS